MKTIKICLALFVMLALTNCNPEDQNILPDGNGHGTFDVKFQPDLKNTIYTSAIFGLAEVERLTDQAIDFFYIHYRSDKNAEIRITIEESVVNYQTVIVQKVKQGDNVFSPKLKWKYEDLKRMAQPGYTDITFVCTDKGGREIGRKDMKISYRAINECVLAAQLDNKTYPLFFLMGSYINEDSPIVDAFLKEVLRYTTLDAFYGYQGGTPESVIRQVAAIFLTLRAMGVKYSSITDTSNSNPKVASQYIRFADEIMNNTQANCADGTVFFCSILRKIGIHAVMIFQPGHVYLGYYADRNKKQLYLLETTMVGTKASFEQATLTNVKTFNSNLRKYTNDDYFDMYFMIDVDVIRKVIKPIGR